MTQPIPTSIPISRPLASLPRRYDFDHIPKLGPAKPGDVRGSLLPQYGGHPGLIYAQVPLAYVRYAEAASPPWLPMHDARRYTIIGPKGSIDMELMAQGRIIKGLAPQSGVRRCLLPFTTKPDGTKVNVICEATGLDPETGFPPEPGKEPVEVQLNGQEPESQVAGREGGGQPTDPQQEDPQGEARGPGPDPKPSGGKGGGHPQAQKR